MLEENVWSLRRGFTQNYKIAHATYIMKWCESLITAAWVLIWDSVTWSTWEAAQTPKALSTTSTILCVVSTLPPTTAAVGDGSRRLPEGIWTVTGTIQPCSSYHLKNNTSLLIMIKFFCTPTGINTKWKWGHDHCSYYSNLGNRPFYSCGWKRGWGWPCFDTNLLALLCKSSYSYAN